MKPNSTRTNAAKLPDAIRAQRNVLVLIWSITAMADRIAIPGQSSANAIPPRPGGPDELRRHRRMLFPHAFSHRHLHFLEGANLNLPNPLPRYVELGGQIFQR